MISIIISVLCGTSHLLSVQLFSHQTTSCWFFTYESHVTRLSTTSCLSSLWGSRLTSTVWCKRSVEANNATSTARENLSACVLQTEESVVWKRLLLFHFRCSTDAGHCAASTAGPRELCMIKYDKQAFKMTSGNFDSSLDLWHLLKLNHCACTSNNWLTVTHCTVLKGEICPESEFLCIALLHLRQARVSWKPPTTSESASPSRDTSPNCSCS